MDMLRVARAADKYKCIIALQPTMRLWLEISWPHRSAFRSTVDVSHQLFTAAYLVRDVEAFRNFGRELALYSSASIRKTHVELETDLVGEVLSKKKSPLKSQCPRY